MKNAVVIQAERIAADYLGEQVRSAYQIVGKGFVNQVCVVEGEQRKIVIRMNDRGTYPDYVKEQWCMEQAAAVGIPGPEVLAVGIADETAYMILTFVEGCNGLDLTSPANDVWRQLGAYARRMHVIPVHGYGEQLTDPAQGRFHSPPHPGSDGSWLGCVQYNIDSLTEDDRLIELGVITRAESQRVRELFERLKQTTFSFGLYHGDMSLKNTLVDEAGQAIVLDWGSAEVGVVPHGEVLQVLQSQMLGEGPNREEFQAFIDGYGLNEEDLAGMRPMQLLRAFDKLRWAIDRSPDLIEAYAAFAKRVVEMSAAEIGPGE
ncbi:aminoglycoside phosphotransferase family protein [Paenibacillus rhizovicinus]|uniref:Aminoglycoside phosphotransferase family protein n=1 Tax=Paenibacillus rhizovicinus TaxID=2704463 RepID=A0A6C0NYX7_9BACL|nr:aminoglycoside phosphotransferase family protein [Paenibacillus rhizovicinus]QHW30903.1 aminoglycoside phosphotransferase family protein [Paenibacillus rhizovicinus]